MMEPAVIVTEAPTPAGDAFTGADEETSSMLILVLITAVTFSLTACVCVCVFFCMFYTKPEDRVMQMGNYMDTTRTTSKVRDTGAAQTMGAEVQMHEIDVTQTKPETQSKPYEEEAIEVYQTQANENDYKPDYQPHVMVQDLTADNYSTPGMGTLGDDYAFGESAAAPENSTVGALAAMNYGSSEGTITKREASDKSGNYGGAAYVEVDEGPEQTSMASGKRIPRSPPPDTDFEGGHEVTGVDLLTQAEPQTSQPTPST